MVYINEWLPNPAGIDKGAEWAELFNDGAAPVALGGWTLVGGNGKKFIFSGQKIDADGYLVLNQSETKLTLRNQNESLSLYDAQGELVSKSSFSGSFLEGKSYSRTGDPVNGRAQFVFAEPTPGAANEIVKEFLTAQMYPMYQPLNKTFGGLDVFALALFIGLIYPVLIIAIFKKNEYLSKLFFKRDEEIGQGTG